MALAKARDILTSFHSVSGAVFSVTTSMNFEKQKQEWIRFAHKTFLLASLDLGA
jgi:hypothetical protein